MNSGRFWLLAKRAIDGLEPYVRPLLYGCFAAYAVLALALGVAVLLVQSGRVTADQIAALRQKFAFDHFMDLYFLTFIIVALLSAAIHRGSDWIGRLVRYMGHAVLGALVGVAVVWIADKAAIDNLHSAILSTNYDYQLAAYIVAFFVVAALCRAAYKRRELLPLAVIYVASVGALVGFMIGAGIIGGWTAFVGALPFTIQLGLAIIAILGGIVINLRSKYSKRPRQTLGATLLGINRFFERSDRAADFSWFVVFRVGGAIAAVVGIYYMIHFEDWGQSLLKTTNGRPENPGLAIVGLFLIFWPARYVVIAVLGVLAYFAVLELWWLLIALVGKKKPLEDEKAHGKAGKATEAAAIGAARGSTGRPPWADHRYKD